MPASLESPADIVNAALAHIGYRNRVSHLFEGSRAAKNALDIYGQTRDALLRDGEWPFAQRDMLAVLIKSAPPAGYSVGTPWDPITYPPLPWLYQYTYPDDCLKVRTLKDSLVGTPNFNPKPNLFAVLNNAGQRAIVSNIPNAVLTYVGQVTNPTYMPPDFVEAFVESLGRRLAPLLANLDAAKLEAQAEQVEGAMASRQQG
jgi:hypothetical protein